MRSFAKKITSILLALAMVFTLMPAVSPVYAADTVLLPSGEVLASTLEPGHNYKVSINGTTIVLEDGDDVTIDSIIPEDSPSVLTIKGSDSGKLTVTEGIQMEQSGNGLVIEGGTLIIDKTSSGNWGKAIAASHYTQHGGTVNAKITTDAGINIALFANYGLLIDGGTLNLTAVTGSGCAYGIKNEGADDSRVVINGGTINITANGDDAVVIGAQNLDVTGGKITGTGTGILDYAFGIYRFNNQNSSFNMSGGEMDLTLSSVGRATVIDSQEIEIKDGALTGTATSSSGYAYGVFGTYTKSKFTVSGGSLDVTASAGEGSISYGLNLVDATITGGSIKASANKGNTAYGIRFDNGSANITISDAKLDLSAKNARYAKGIGSDCAISFDGCTVTIDATGTEQSTFGIEMASGDLKLKETSLDIKTEAVDSTTGLYVYSLDMTDSDIDIETKATGRYGTGAYILDSFDMTGGSMSVDLTSSSGGTHGIQTGSRVYDWNITDAVIDVNVISATDDEYDGCYGIEINSIGESDLVDITDSTIKTTCKAPNAQATGLSCNSNLRMNGETTIEAIGEGGLLSVSGVFVNRKLTMTGDQAVLYGKATVSSGGNHYGITAYGGIELEEGAGYTVTKPTGGVIDEDGHVRDAGGDIAAEAEIKVPRYRLYLSSYDTEDGQLNKPYFLITSNVTGDTPQPGPREYWLKEGESVTFSVSVDESAPYNYDFSVWRTPNASGTDFSTSPEAGIVMGTSNISLCAVMKRHFDKIETMELVSDMTEILAGETAGTPAAVIEKSGATADQYYINEAKWKDVEADHFMEAGEIFVRGKTYKLYIYAFAKGSDGYIWADTVDATYNGEPLTRENTNVWTKTFVAKEYHTVTFDPRNGESTWTEAVEWNNPAPKPADPVREGWTFDSWGKDSVTASGNYFSSSPAGITADTTLYARYSAVLKASASGGKIAVKPIGEGVAEEDYMASVLIPVNEKTEGPVTSRGYTLYAKASEGFIFGGWFKYNDETAQYDFVSTMDRLDIYFTGEATYKAVFDRDPDYVPNLRIYGKSRYETAYKAADYLKSLAGVERHATVIVADGRNFADALSGSYLAAVTQAPIILVHPSYEGEVLEYIAGNVQIGGRIYLLGGKGAVSEEFEEQLRNASFDVVRLGGKTRYDTNVVILNEANSIDGTHAKEVLVCSGTGFADALSTSSVGKPILLVGKEFSDSQKAYMTDIGITDAWIIGGTGAVSAEIEDALGAYVSADHTKRIKGKSRFETSRAVADEFFPGSHTTAVLVYGMTFPDGLSGGAVAAMLGAPVLLCTGNATDNSPAAMWVSEAGAYKSVTFGGIKLIPDEQVRTIMDQPDAEIVVYGA